MMKTIYINDIKIEALDNQNILKAARENGIDIPALCFLEDCNNIGQCGVCLVEIEGQERLARACCVKPKDGMKIFTDNERVKEERKAVIGKLLDNHDFKCGKCKRKENCEFLKLVIKTKARSSKPFEVKHEIYEVDDRSEAIVMNRSKCLTCGRCVATCRHKVGTKAISFQRHDNERVVGTENFSNFDDTKCLLCGQCVAGCPVDALSEKSHIERVEAALADENKHVIVAMAPAVRTAFGEMFKLGYGKDVTGKLYTALRQLGFDKVFDINFGADITIMEEATELLQRMKAGGPFPMFTSCCPSWVRLLENYYPELLNNLSTVKSPQQVFGAASKTYYADLTGIAPENIFTVTIMPCTAKKFEAGRPEMENNGVRNIDAVLTTRELAAFVKKAKIDFVNLEDGQADPAMGEYTGAGTIFGATGGVMEAAIRTAKEFAENKSFDAVEYTGVRGLEGIKEASVMVDGKKVKVAVVNGSANFFDFIESGKLKENNYHFIEVMSCNGGCVNGGGQPHVTDQARSEIDIRTVRASVLYNQDKNLKVRKSHENTAVKKMYDNYMEAPGSHRAHELLHTKYNK